MKSPMIQNASWINEEEKEKYSELQVLVSAAGYYIGTIYTSEDGYNSPGSRDSEEYYGSEEEAQEALDKGTYTQRMQP